MLSTNLVTLQRELIDPLKLTVSYALLIARNYISSSRSTALFESLDEFPHRIKLLSLPFTDTRTAGLYAITPHLERFLLSISATRWD